MSTARQGEGNMIYRLAQAVPLARQNRGRFAIVDANTIVGDEAVMSLLFDRAGGPAPDMATFLPPVLTDRDGTYLVVDGAERLVDALNAGWARIPAVVTRDRDARQVAAVRDEEEGDQAVGRAHGLDELPGASEAMNLVRSLKPAWVVRGEAFEKALAAIDVTMLGTMQASRSLDTSRTPAQHLSTLIVETLRPALDAHLTKVDAAPGPEDKVVAARRARRDGFIALGLEVAAEVGVEIVDFKTIRSDAKLNQCATPECIGELAAVVHRKGAVAVLRGLMRNTSAPGHRLRALTLREIKVVLSKHKGAARNARLEDAIATIDFASVRTHEGGRRLPDEKVRANSITTITAAIGALRGAQDKVGQRNARASGPELN